jgi:hypothetical protein
VRLGYRRAVRLGYRRELGAIADPAEREARYEQLVAQQYERGSWRGLDTPSTNAVLRGDQCPRWHDDPMSSGFDYFSAVSDETAAGTVNLPGGPGAPLADSAGESSFDTVHVQGIDPLVQLCTLEALLTERAFEQIVAGPRAGRPLAAQDGGQSLVVTLTDELQAALAKADDEILASVAAPWTEPDEPSGPDDAQSLTGLLRGLAELARRATAKNERMYCWMCA